MPAGAVLTGGASRRMGSDKALVRVDGRPMALRVAGALAEAGCDPVVLVGGDEGRLAPLGLPVVADIAPGEGPLGGVVSALRRFDGHDDLVVVSPCDMPYLTGDTIIMLVERIAADDGGDLDVVVARSERIEPLCAVWRTSSLPAVESAFAAGERAVHRLLGALRVAHVAIDPARARNINAPDDLAQ